MKAALLWRMMNLWPPLWGSGIAFTGISDDFRSAEVALSQRGYNRTFHGAHFGGSLFAMTDVGYTLLFANIMGPDYVVWDKRAEIEFVSPGFGTVTARFHVDDEALARIYAETADGGKSLPEFDVEVVDASGALVARARRVIYIRKRPGGRSWAGNFGMDKLIR